MSALGLLILVLYIGESEIGDVQRWFYVGDFRLQPSFPAMLLHVVAMAALLDYRPKERRLEVEGEIPQDRPGLLLYLLSSILASMSFTVSLG